VKTDILDRGPDNGQATGLGREHVNLVSALSHEASETFDGVGRLNVTLHGGRKRIKRQEMFFVFSQAAHRFGIAHRVLGGSRQLIGSMPPTVWVVPRYQAVRPGHRRALVWG
jgi:hypothetical protein